MSEPEPDVAPKAKVKSSILIIVEMIYEDGNVRVDVRSGRPWNDLQEFPLSARVRLAARNSFEDELKKFAPRSGLA